MTINVRFASCYRALYWSKVAYSGEELDSFLGQITFPTLTDEARTHLISTITLKEVQQTLCELQAGKTPGVDGLPPEFYRQYGVQLSPRLHEMIVKTLKEKTLLASMAEAIIVVIPKPGKDPELCTSYCPISFLNADAKILTKVLPRRLNEVILILIYEDQTRFMLGKGTDVNLRRLY